MARNDGIDRTVARNQDLPTPDDVAKIQEHNEREKDSYSNQDIVPERTSMNVHFKAPTDDYVKMFEQMEQDGVISTRGLKPDAVKYGELIFDVNSAYFCNHGGYEFAKEFYADAYKAAVEIVGGEQYILSAVMHADERNRAMYRNEHGKRNEMRQVPADIAGGLPGECQDDKNGNGLQIRRFARYGGSMGEGRKGAGAGTA